MGVTEHIFKSHNFAILPLVVFFFWGGGEFCIHFYEISHDDKKDIIRTHICGYLALWGQNSVSEQNIFNLSKLPVFYRNYNNRYWKHSLKIWA